MKGRAFQVRRWTEQESAEVRQAYLRRESPARIAQRLGRSVDAIKQQAAMMNVRQRGEIDRIYDQGEQPKYFVAQDQRFGAAMLDAIRSGREKSSDRRPHRALHTQPDLRGAAGAAAADKLPGGGLCRRCLTRKEKRAMARKPSQKKTEAPEITAASPLDDDQLQALFFQHKKSYETRLAAKKKADADFKNSCKHAKAELGKGAVDRIKTAIQLETEEGEAALKAKIEGELQVARWMGASIGTQFEMFNGEDRTPAVDRAFDEGKRAGLKGDPCNPCYSAETEQYRRYMAGFHDGQAVLAKGIKPKSDEDADLRPPFLQRAEAERDIGSQEASYKVN